MSRSLDNDILSNLKSEDPTKVYRDISSILNHPPGDGLLEIELLGSSHPLEAGVHFLQDENAIAIPKLRLVQAFFVAREILSKHLLKPSSSPKRETVEATSVILLMDPEHLTAANIRKKAIVAQLQTGTLPTRVLQEERQLVDSLLTSRLHRHTKSPTLWSHRRWLIQSLGSLQSADRIRSDLINVVMVAAERHPRNYYAWSHARWLLDVSSSDASFPPLFYKTVVGDVKTWCFKHHDDISGWTFLQWILVRIQDVEQRQQECSLILRDTLNIVQSFHWTNTSVWNFLQMLVVREFVGRDDFESFLHINDFLSSSSTEDGGGSSASRTLARARQWAAQHRQAS
ncbi:protein prenyltransferase alpha subunit repeat-containing protein 1 [Apiospora arundinis]|uniref:Protein prenyltransferase alpha subunit repeat-containing protein 1-B n=1 Tax=Apiospora arundinis TaxID=335852 RepID=A0ABR2IG07_9PEZI